jgi:GntR family transcriptional regulator/MocR family aminotransferase
MNGQFSNKSAVQFKTRDSDGRSARAIYEAIREQIVSGVYAAGSKIPSTRALAVERGVARSTVTAAYEQLASEGFIESTQGAPTRVGHVQPRASGDFRKAKARPVPVSAFGERVRRMGRQTSPDRSALHVDFRYGDLAGGDFPTLQWKRLVNAAASHRPARLQYADPRGSSRLRQALQGYLWRARGIRCDVDQVLIVSGSQQGLDLCARILLDPQDAFIMENPGYAMARQAFAATGARPIFIAADRHGLDTGALAGIDARLAYVTPSHQYPLGGVMRMARRGQLLSWAEDKRAVVVEDDYDSEYRYDIKPVPPLYGLARASTVIYVGTISKILSPTLRLGYLIVPAGFQDVFIAAKDICDRHTVLYEQEALAAMIESGAYERHIRTVRRRNGERRAWLIEALQRVLGDAVSIEGADAGLHIVVWLNKVARGREKRLLDAAWDIGLGLYSISPLYAEATAKPDRIGLVLGYAPLGKDQIARGVELLAKAIASVRRAKTRS